MSDPAPVFHYTDSDGYKAIGSQVEWTFKAAQPPGEREFGAEFTTFRVDANRFYARTRIPVKKQPFVFIFTGRQGLRPMRGGRGQYILLSPVDYTVVQQRQVGSGETYAALSIVKGKP